MTTGMDAPASAQSPRARFAISLVGNGLRSALNLVSSMMLARWLGPSNYGQFVFVTGSVGAMRQLFDLGTSTAFFTLVSRSPRSARFLRRYWVWLGLQIGAAVFLVAALVPDALLSTALPGITRVTATLAVAAVFMQGSIWSAATQGAEANRKTLPIQIIGLVLAAVHLLAMALLHLVGVLAVPVVLLTIAVEWGMAAAFASRLHAVSPDEEPHAAKSLRSMIKMFQPLCLPLIPYVLLGVFYAYGDRWMLQVWAGASEQAYFGLAQQFAGVALLVGVSMTPVLWKEVAAAHHIGDGAGALRRYRRASQVLMFASAAIAGLLMPWSADLLLAMLGGPFVGGAAVFAVMLWYPVQQTVGQLQGTYLYASGRPRLQVVTGSVAMLIGLCGSYFVLAPKDAALPGLELGAIGLAARLMVVQFGSVTINDMMIFGARAGFNRCGFQVLVVGACLCSGLLSAFAARLISSALPIQLTIAWVLGAILLCAIVVMAPNFAGLTRHDLRAVSQWCRTRVSHFNHRGA